MCREEIGCNQVVGVGREKFDTDERSFALLPRPTIATSPFEAVMFKISFNSYIALTVLISITAVGRDGGMNFVQEQQSTWMCKHMVMVQDKGQLYFPTRSMFPSSKKGEVNR